MGRCAGRALFQCTVGLALLTGCGSATTHPSVADRYDRTLGAGIRAARLLLEPDDGVTPLVRAIDRARKTVWVEAYFLSQARIVRALERAATQGVDVRVILEHSPYGLGDQPIGIANRLRAANSTVRWAPRRFALDHSKVMLLDSRLAVIASANFSRAGFAEDRDVVTFDRRPQDVGTVSAIFRADWDNLPAKFADPDLVVSPDNSRYKIDHLLLAARHSIDIYAEEFVDGSSARLLRRIARRGVRVRVLLPPGAAPAGARGIRFRELAVPYIHAKVIMVDGRETFVGSENFSAPSLDRNREVGILLRGVPARLARCFGQDWRRAVPAKPSRKGA